MTSKKWTVIISATLTAIGIIVFAILQFELYRYVIIFVDNTAGFYLKLSHALHTWDSNNGELLSQWDGFGKIISSGILTSALVTLLVAGNDYFDGRRKALKRVFYASEDLQRIFGKIKYVFPDEPKKLVGEFISEIDRNAGNEKYNQLLMKELKKSEDADKAKKLYDECHMPITHDAENRFKEYIWEHTEERIKEDFKEPSMKKDYLDDVCKKKIEQYSEQLDVLLSNFGSTCQLILFDNARIYYIMEEKKFSYSLLGLDCLLILVGLLIQPRREKAHEKTKKQRKYPYFKGQNLPKG